MLSWLGVAAAPVISITFSAMLSWCGPVDRPRERGLHTTPTPTCGGLAIIAGSTAAALFFAGDLGGLGAQWALSFGFALAMGLFGALDDLLDLPAKVKLAAQTALALAFACAAPPLDSLALTGGFTLHLPVWLAVLGETLWIVVIVNAVNFMDGADGLVAGAMAIVLLGLAAVFWALQWVSEGLAVSAVALAALGFLPLNFPRARLFQGDAGALFLGATVASLWLVIGRHTEIRSANPMAGPSALSPFLADVLLTLMARARRRAPLLNAHRDHLYQRWLAAHGGAHAALTWRVWGVMIGFGVIAFIAAISTATVSTALLVVAIAVSVVGWLWIDRGLRQAP